MITFLLAASLLGAAILALPRVARVRSKRRRGADTSAVTWHAFCEQDEKTGVWYDASEWDKVRCPEQDHPDHVTSEDASPHPEGPTPARHRAPRGAARRARGRR